MGDGGEGAVRQLFPISTQSTCSQPVTTPLRGSQGQSSRVELKEVRGLKYLQLEGHPYLFSHIHAAHRASQACLSSVMYKSEPEVNVLPPSGSDYAFSSLFPVFSPQPSSSEFCCCALSMLAPLPWLVQVLSPPCNLRLGMLNSSHSCPGVYVSTCCSPHIIHMASQKFI